jgi:hypothetical protein
MKTKSNPRNPNTAQQRIVRSAMAGATVKWRAMTTAQRKVWDEWGKTLEKEDILGNKIDISGWSAFAGAFILATRGGVFVSTVGTNTSIKSGYFSIGTINAVQGSVLSYFLAVNLHIFWLGITPATLNAYKFHENAFTGRNLIHYS